jgi:CDP-diacylglycerol pyrophosphatase
LQERLTEALQNVVTASNLSLVMTIRLFLRPAFALCCLLVAAVALQLLAAEDAAASDRGDLWRVVHDLCAPMDRVTGLPLPCLKIDRDGGVAVVRAPTDVNRIIVVPTRKIPGVESPLLLGDDGQNLWAAAWGQRQAVIAAASRPLAWSDIGMAVNSQARRTQDQFHIHVSCVDPRLKRALRLHPPRRSGWFDLDLGGWADTYRAKRIEARDLDRNLFRMVADELPGARESMGEQSLAVIGYGAETGEHGFVLMDSGDGGHAEELLDHSCQGDRR